MAAVLLIMSFLLTLKVVFISDGCCALIGLFSSRKEEKIIVVIVCFVLLICLFSMGLLGGCRDKIKEILLTDERLIGYRGLAEYTSSLNGPDLIAGKNHR